MKLVDAIRSSFRDIELLEGQKKDDKAGLLAAYRFLFNKTNPKPGETVQQNTLDLIDRLGLDGDDFGHIGDGAHHIVYGNGNVVFKLEYDPHPLEKHDWLPLEKIPKKFAANIIAQGNHNEVNYLVAERLSQKHIAHMEEIIPFLFQLRDEGFSYYDAKPKNFGYDKNGDLKILDFDHFQTLGIPEKSFEDSLLIAAESLHREQTYPVITFDDHNTYIMFNPNNVTLDPANDAQNEILNKTVLSGLAAAGIDKDSIEVIGNPKLIKVTKTEINYGPPDNKTEDLADLIDRTIRNALANQKNTKSVINNDIKER